MRLRHLYRLMVGLITGTALVGCSAQAPSEVPAVDALVRLYDQNSGVWPTTGWWNSANALTALTNYMIESGDHRYSWVLQNTYDKKIHAEQGDFINPYVDDTGWWALAWIRAYDLTGDRRYLDTAQQDVDFMWSNHDGACGGGLWWTVNHEYKNAIANELFIKAAAELATRIGRAGQNYLQHAITVWQWFDQSGLITNDHLVTDGLDRTSCAAGGTLWTYNQGVLLGALADLTKATGDPSYLDRARTLADASTASKDLNVDGVLTESCEQNGCDINGPSFKGIYVRCLGELNRALKDHPYTKYLVGQANIAHDHDRNSDNEYGLHWAGPVDHVTAASQQSAVDLLVAAQPIPRDSPTAVSSSPSA
ncbi:Glycosyl hydrolase family 76 [Nakamurella panacisegetis]|uniref:Glycosyl hydrolase family 76 n=1 Tax=Nakamurella panacisegetis TaxID=1090615 RepID=A0A1H0IXS8_9ACTN|nr:glycoside hydrolase family 76 protein [Nakamurella panacisegetis]SDO36163.1 Glycosyl hydrolase family 76 [Nakamurella panacisegetis]